MSYTVGQYLADRLVQIGLKDHFAIAGDYNLSLLDELAKNKEWKQIYSCNELNCGFSAEGYARVKGAAACVVTFNVGAFSAMNSALGGAYAENLPVLCICGAPNSNEHGSGHILHHTIGTSSYHYQMEMVKHITCAAESITQAEEATAKIDHVIRTMLREQKPAYLEIACNIANAESPRPGPIDGLLPHMRLDEVSLDAALKKILNKIEKTKNIVLYVGPKVRAAKAQKEIIALADKIGCAVVNGAGAMSYFPGQHPSFRGTYWGCVSTGEAEKLVNEAETLIVLGPNWNDFETVGWKAWPKGAHVVTIEAERAIVENEVFTGLSMKELVRKLAESAASKPFSAQSSSAPHFEYPLKEASQPLDNREMARQIQGILTENTTIYAEAGSSWFNIEEMNWPNGLRVETEMQWGHIGWCIPSGLGNALAAPERQHIIMVGDGSFQFTVQEVGQMIRYKLPIIIILIDNNGYGIEKAIHDGPYNYIQNWNYSKVMDLFNAPHADGGLGLKATTGAEFAEALKKAQANKEGPTLIQTCIPADSFTEKLVVWCKEVAKTNGRPPIS